MSNALLVPEFSDISNTFEVEIKRNSLGLGFSISGGPDAPSPWTNLIRVKKIFPLQPAWETGKLKVTKNIEFPYYNITSYRLVTSSSVCPGFHYLPLTCDKPWTFSERPLPSPLFKCAECRTAVEIHGVPSLYQR